MKSSGLNLSLKWISSLVLYISILKMDIGEWEYEDLTGQYSNTGIMKNQQFTSGFCKTTSYQRATNPSMKMDVNSITVSVGGMDAWGGVWKRAEA
jgi:hypothetical protein